MDLKDRGQQRADVRAVDCQKLELIIAELEDMKTRHLSAYFKVSCNFAISELEKAISKLKSLNSQSKKL